MRTSASEHDHDKSYATHIQSQIVSPERCWIHHEGKEEQRDSQVPTSIFSVRSFASGSGKAAT